MIWFVPITIWFTGNFLAAMIWDNPSLPYWANFAEGATALPALGFMAWGFWRQPKTTK